MDEKCKDSSDRTTIDLSQEGRPSLAVSDVRIKSMIYTVRGEQVMLDSDLAKLYGVETRTLNQAVTRNPDRFPERFCFRLTKKWDGDPRACPSRYGRTQRPNSPDAT
jgi:hypothetical protein